MNRLYFLKRHGGFFKPGAHGYTDDIFQAGIFEHDKAMSYGDVESPRVEVIPIHELRDDVVLALEDARKAARSAIGLLQVMDIGRLPTMQDVLRESLSNHVIDGESTP